MTCAKQFWKKMYTGWVMSIERQGNQGSTSPDTMCVVPYIAFCVQCLLLYQDSVKFIMILMTPEPCITHHYLHAIWSIPHLFFHNAIALPELKFIFKHLLFVIFKQLGIDCDFSDFLGFFESHISEPFPEMIDAVQCVRSEGLKTAVLSNFWRYEDQQLSPLPINRNLFDVVGRYIQYSLWYLL